MRKIALFNTYNTVIPVMEKVCEVLNDEKTECYSYVTNKAYREHLLKKNYFRYIKLPRFILSSKKAVYLTYTLAAFWHILKSNLSFAILFTQPPLAHIILSVALRLRKIPYVIHVMDMFPEILYELSYLKRSSYIGRMLSTFSNQAMKNAEKIVVIGRCMKERLNKIGIANEHIEVIEVFAFDTVPFPSTSEMENVKFNELDFDNKLLITYAGNMGNIHSFREVQDLMLRLKEEKLSYLVKFILIGGGTKRESLEEFVLQNDLRNVQMKDSMDPESEEFKYILYKSHFHLITMKDGLEGVAVPSKFYSALYSGSSVLFIGNEKSEVFRVVKENNTGMAFSNNMSSSIFDSIKEILTLRNYPKLMCEEIVQIYNQNYHSEVFKKKYIAMINSIISNA